MLNLSNPIYESVFFNSDGTPVEPENTVNYRGTPDNITKAGCIALLERSNADLQDKSFIWNTWRKNHPVKNPGLVNCTNYVDLSNVNFSEDSAKFSNFQFGEFAKFCNSKFPEYTNFCGAKFNNGADFQNTKFSNNAIFTEATFDGFSDFSNSIFGSYSNFKNVIFSFYTNFSNVEIGSHANFNIKSPSDTLIFTNADIGPGFSITGTLINCDFENVTFKKNMAFSCEVSGKANFAGAQFLGEANFNNSHFKGSTSFSQSDKQQTKFSIAPQFHSAKLHSDTSFEGAKFPKASGDEIALRGYRTLKLAFSSHQAAREELLFFKREMEEETLLAGKRDEKEKHSETLNGFRLPAYFFQIYEYLADYGFSVSRPIKRLIGFGIILTYLGCSVIACTNGWSLELTKLFTAETWVFSKFVLSGAIPFWEVKFESEEKALLIQLFGTAASPSFLLLVTLSTLQKLLSIVGWFFVGLALRNHFKVK